MAESGRRGDRGLSGLILLPSGIVALLTAAGVHFSPELQEAIISAGLGLIDVIAIFWKERGAKDVKPVA